MSKTSTDEDESFLGCPISETMRARMLRECWKACEPNDRQFPDMKSCFDSYPSRCRPYLHDGGLHVSIKTYSELIELTTYILEGSSRKNVVAKALPACQNNPTIDNQAGDTAVALCVALLFMVDIGSHRFRISDSTTLFWPADQTFRQAVAQHFQSQKATLQSENARLGKLFTARNLKMIGGLKIEWTNNLVDHLRLADDDKTVFIFHSVSFLKFHQT